MKKVILWITFLFIVFIISEFYREYKDITRFKNSLKEAKYWEDPEANLYMMEFFIENRIKDNFKYKKIKFIEKFPHPIDSYELIYNIERERGWIDDLVGISFGMNNDEEIDIYIDNSYWIKINSITKKKLIYHELGHDVLNLDHSTDPNDYMYEYILND
tara:strand:+ start:542 stop:1018 length:477 start_codon:yes stop_codon:yes gene_type:complete